MGQLLCCKSGLNATISVYSDEIVISRKGIHAMQLGDETRVRLTALQGINYKEAGFSVGYCKLLLPGDRKDMPGTDKDPYAVMFKKMDNSEMEQVRSCILSALERIR